MARYPGTYDDNSARNPDRSAQSAAPCGSAGSDQSQTGGVADDLDEQSLAIGQGVLSMPLHVARRMVSRWAEALRGRDDVRLVHIADGLVELNGILAEEPVRGNQIGALLTRLGMETRAVASDRYGALGMALDRLADGLIFAGSSLKSEIN